MTTELRPNVPEDDGGAADARAHGAALYGAIGGQLTVGRFVLEVGSPHGAIVREAGAVERPTSRRQTPVLVRPRPVRNLFGRQGELDAVLTGLGRGLHVEVRGEPGIGKTALLRYLAYHPVVGSYPDGVVYLPARHQSSPDLVQLILEAFYESARLWKPTDAEIRRDLQDTQALIILDDVDLGEEDLERVLDIAPRSTFVVSTRTRCLSGEVRSLRVEGVLPDEAVLLLEREIERPLEPSERSPAARLCVALGGHPLRILRAAAVIRDCNVPIGEQVKDLVPDRLLGSVMAPLDHREQRVLMAMAALRGAPLAVQHISNIADLPNIGPLLLPLVRRGLVVRSEARYRLTEGVADRLQRTHDLKPSINRAITYFGGWAERHRRNANVLLEDSAALLALQQQAGDERRWHEVLLLGRFVEGALVLGPRWGAWEVTLERCLTAAKSIGDRSAEAWALHQIGTRALCLGETRTARAVLAQAVQLRQGLNDTVAVEASQRNLGFVLAPAPAPTPAPAPVPAPALASESSSLGLIDPLEDFASLPLRDEVLPDIARSPPRGPRMLPVFALLFAVAGGFAYWSPAARDSLRSLEVSSLGLVSHVGANRSAPVLGPRPSPVGTRGSQPEAATVTPVDAGLGPPAAAPAPEADGEKSNMQNATVLIFTARPGSIVTAGSTDVCYAVTDAVQVRIDPEVGDVPPSTSLTCRRVAPRQTTTYTLTASGRDGTDVSRQVVIAVR